MKTFSSLAVAVATGLLFVRNGFGMPTTPDGAGDAAAASRTRAQDEKVHPEHGFRLHKDLTDSNEAGDHWRQQQSIVSQLDIPSRYETTVLARRMLALSTESYVSTNFPHQLPSSRVPDVVHDTPIALPEYIASCEEPTGNPTILAITISTFMQNVRMGSNVSMAVSWWDEYVKYAHKEPWSKANLPRMSLLGHLESISLQEAEEKGLVECFTALHGDSRFWLPGSKSSPHSGTWARMVVDEVYWFGGFGDRNYIGWLDPEEWRNVTVEEWKAVRLPGET